MKKVFSELTEMPGKLVVMVKINNFGIIKRNNDNLSGFDVIVATNFKRSFLAENKMLLTC